MESCPICFTEIDIEANIHFVKLECKHSICNECYQRWHIQLCNSDCVICRKTVVNIQPTPQHSSDNTIQILYSNLGMILTVLLIVIVFFTTVIITVKDSFWKIICIMFSVTIIPLLLISIDNILCRILRIRSIQQNIELNNVQS
jgi:hypothetical protein